MNSHARADGLAAALTRASWFRAAAVVLSTFWTPAVLGQSYQPPPAVCVSPPTLGTFQETPYVMIGGAGPIGGGYSPLGIYGDGSMALNGPFAPSRSTSAPITTYSRGYDGVVRARSATSFSNPNQPRLSPVVYPTPRNYYYAPRVNRTPPWWTSGFNWIDQN